MKSRILIYIFLITFLIIFTGCAISKVLKGEEVAQISKSLYESSEKIKTVKKLSNIGPNLEINVVYKDSVSEKELDNEEIAKLVSKLEQLIDIDVIKKINYKNDVHIDQIYVNVYIGNTSRVRVYQLYSRYHKEPIVNDDPNNVDGYKSWSVYKECD